MLSSIKYVVGYLVSVVIVSVTKTFFELYAWMQSAGQNENLLQDCYESSLLVIGIDQTAKHALGYKFFSADCVRVAKTFLGCLLLYA